MVITSPPYWALRDYKVSGQIGLELDFHQYIDKLLKIFDEVKRVLKVGGTCWVNLGDTYACPGKLEPDKFGNRGKSSILSGKIKLAQGEGRTNLVRGKSLIGIPERFMLGMIDHGWILRNKIIWHKPNHMPCSVKDRFANSWEYLFLFVKSKKYYFNLNAVREPHKRGTAQAERDFHRMMAGKQTFGGVRNESDDLIQKAFVAGHPLGRNPDDIISVRQLAAEEDDYWDIPTKPFKEAHFAVFPEALIERPIKTSPRWVCIKCGRPREPVTHTTRSSSRLNISTLRAEAKDQDCRIAQPNIRYEASHVTIGWTDCGCNAGFQPGLILDPFIGSGTTALVAKRLGRDYIGFDLKPEYVAMAQARLNSNQNEDKGGQSQPRCA